MTRTRFEDGPPGVAEWADARAPKPIGDVDVMTQRWSRQKREAFKLLAPAGIAFVASDGPVSVTTYSAGGDVVRRFGHNRGVWPARFSNVGVWKDSTTQAWNKNPFFFLGTQFRLWTRTPALRDRLLETYVDRISALSDEHGGLERLEHGFLDLGSELDLSLFELELHDIARRSLIHVWDDAGLSEFLDRVLVRAQQLASAGKCGRSDPVEVAIMSELNG